MFHKILTAAAVLLFAFSLYAQKPVSAAVTDIEDDPSNGLEMCRSLFNEYFLSELTTHAKVNMLDTASIQKSVAKLQLSRGQDLSEKQLKELCEKLQTDALCLVKMARNAKKEIVITVKLVNRDGKKIGSVSAAMKGIGDTDSVSSVLAGKCAVILRKLRGIEEPEVKKSEGKSAQPLPSTVTEI